MSNEAERGGGAITLRRCPGGKYGGGGLDRQ